MKISVLTPNFSSNCLGRAWLLADILRRCYEVEIIGPVLGEGIWRPLAEQHDIPYRSVRTPRRLSHLQRFRELLRAADGDAIYVSKPLFWSYEIGLISSLLSRRPLVVDIDDWELGFLRADRDLRRSGRIALDTSAPWWNRVTKWLRQTRAHFLVAMNERLVTHADKITVSSPFLQNRFGGTLIWHARDTTVFNPDTVSKNAVRKNHGLDADQSIVVFWGTLRSHKGIEDLVTALIKVPRAVLMLVEAGDVAEVQALVSMARKRLGTSRVHAFPPQLFAKTPQFLAMADVVAIPQRCSGAALGQVPAKVFDAMAMAKPIVATAVGALPEIIGDCGWIVDPGQPDQLADIISEILAQPEEAENRGRRARERCKSFYSYDAVQEILCRLFEDLRLENRR